MHHIDEKGDDWRIKNEFRLERLGKHAGHQIGDKTRLGPDNESHSEAKQKPPHECDAGDRS